MTTLVATSRAGVALALGLALAAGATCTPPPESVRSTFVRAVDTDSDKAVSVVEDVRFEGHEPRRLAPETLQRLLLASGFFLPDDASLLAEPIADELSGMAPSEYVRVTAWADDGVRRTFVWISGGRLHLAYFRRDIELDRYAAPIPSENVATFAAVDAAPAPPPPVEPSMTDAGVPVLATPPAPPPKKKKGRCPAIAAKDATPLSEDGARRKLSELDTMRDRGLVNTSEYKCKRKEILARL